MAHYNIKEQFYAYSKKKGMYSKTVFVLRNVTWEEAVEFMQKQYNKTPTPLFEKGIKHQKWPQYGLLQRGEVTLTKIGK